MLEHTQAHGTIRAEVDAAALFFQFLHQLSHPRLCPDVVLMPVFQTFLRQPAQMFIWQAFLHPLQRLCIRQRSLV